MVAGSKSLRSRIGSAVAAVEELTPGRWEGRLTAASGRGAEMRGLSHHLSLGDRVTIHGRGGAVTAAEIIALRADSTFLMPFSQAEGLGVGIGVSAPVRNATSGLRVSADWLGRVLDPFGRPLDGGPPPPRGPLPRPLRAAPPEATRRARLGDRMSLGVRAMDLFVTCRHGQRIGLFAGSGVGKSSLLAMLARNAECEIPVIALLGERGREVREFLEDQLGEETLSRSVVVVATSDASPLVRREAAYAAMTIAEYFRDHARKVLLVMDSVTRFCQALREIALAAGEPPASRGYPPTVFAELPRLFERAGPGTQGDGPVGQMTAFFTVLVEGDDHNEPVADAVRGLLDGHVVLDRQIAEKGRFPAIDVLRSLSRAVPGCNAPAENQLVSRARRTLAIYSDVADLVRLGAYRAGADPSVDHALAVVPRIEAILRQGRDECPELSEAFSQLELAMQ
jgi:flagellum-specific ATP synthase